MSTVASTRPTFADPRAGLRLGIASFVAARQRAAMLRLAFRGLAVGGLLAAFAGSLARVFDLAGVVPVALGLLLGGTVVAAIVGWRRRAPETRIALEIDRRLGLDERVTTALELVGSQRAGTLGWRGLRSGQAAARPAASASPPSVSELAEDQIADAVAHLAVARPTSVYPIRLTWRALALAAVTSALAIAPWVVTWPAFLSASVPASRIAATSVAEAARLDAVARRIESQTTPADSSVRARVAAQLRQAADALRQSRANGAQASRDLLQAQQAAAALAPRTGEDASLTLARIADALNSQTVTQPTTSALDQQDVNQAAADLQQLAANVGSMTPDQRQALANALQAASNAAQGSETSAAQQLQQAANAAKNGDAQGMQQAAQALQQLGAASQAQRDVSQAQSELQSSSEAISQASQNGSAATDPSASSQSASSQPGKSNPTGSSNPATAASTGGASQSSPGSPSGSSPSGSTQAGTGQQTGDQQSGGIGTGSTGHLGSPNALQGLAQRQVMVPSDQTGDPTSIQSSNQLQTGVAGTAQVDYVNVLPQYRQQAQQVVEGNVVPTGLKQVVKGYFDSLSPK